MIWSVQYLRFLASILVVLYHGTQSLSKDLDSQAFETWNIGARGVDIFFVISGFIIVLVTERSHDTPGRFILKRLWRVAPIYYLATSAIIAIALVAPALLATTKLELGHVVASFLFLPVDHPVAFSTFPVLPVGWTLNCEVQFYVLFAMLFSLPQRMRVAAVSLAIVVLVAAGFLVQSDQPTFSALTAPILIEFIFGMLLGRLWFDAPTRLIHGTCVLTVACA